MPTRSKPIVSCLSRACAIATLVPTPSAEVASSGRSYALSAEASKSPAKPPIPPITSGRRALSTQTFISSTARSPDSMETPAAAYAFCSVTRLLRVVEDGQRLAVRRRLDRGLQEVLAEQALVGQRDGVLAGEAGRAEAAGPLL